MNILHIGTGVKAILPDSGRAVEDTIYQLARYQARLGHNVQVIDMGTNKSREDTKAGYYGFMSAGVVWFSFELLFVLPFIAKSMDIVHTHSQIPTIISVIIKRLFGYKYKVFYTAHSPYLMMPSSLSNRFYHTLFEGFALRWADRVIVQTKVSGRVISRRYGVRENSIVQIYAGVDLEGIAKYKETHLGKYNKNLIFYPAYINRRKNQMAIIRAEHRCEVVFAGAVEDMAYYQEIKTFLSLRNVKNVKFVGHIFKEDVYKYYQEASIVIFPTHFETQGVVLLEAMAFGVPVIASNIRVIKEIVELEKDSALLVDAEDSGKMSRAIDEVLNNVELRGKLSLGGLKLVNSKFGWDKIAEDTLRAYRC